MIQHHIRTEPWFALFILAHLIGWTFIPTFIRDNLPLDAIEGTLWGHQLEWGYDKNPYLNGWLTALAVYIGGASGWMTYLFSQLSVLACFWVVWRLGRQLFAPQYAFIAVLLLESIQYYNFHAIDFNDNTLELGLWALTIYCFYHALRYPVIACQKSVAPMTDSSLQTQHPVVKDCILQSSRSSINHRNNTFLAGYWIYLPWIGTGLFAGLAFMAKYYTASLLTAMLLLLLSDNQHRKLFTTPLPYCSLLAFLAVTLPHFIWLGFHDFITITYVFERASSPPHWANHFFFPAQFAWQQAEVLLPACLLYCCLFLGKKPYSNPHPAILNAFNKRFLYYLGLGPFLLTLLLSLVLGIKLRAGWGMPLFSLSSLLLLSFYQPRLSVTKIYAFLAGIFALLATLLITYTFSLTHSKDESSANFPGKEIASALTSLWHQAYHVPLAYVAGSRWVGGNIAFYSEDHPAVFVEWDKKRAPWINQDDMKKKGALFVWDLTDNKETLPKTVMATYPNLGPATILSFPWHRNRYGLKPVKIGVAMLKPKKVDK